MVLCGLVLGIGICSRMVQAEEVSSATPVLIMHFDEGSGTTVKDASVNKNTGQIKGEVDWVEGKSGSALKFHKGGGVIFPVGSLGFDANSQMTIEAWVKLDKYPSISGHAGCIVNKYGNDKGYIMGIFSKRILFYFANLNGYAEVKGRTSLTIGKWYHLTVVYDNQDISLYVNRKLEGKGNAGTFISDYETPLQISRWSPGLYFPGTIDEVKIWKGIPDEFKKKEEFIAKGLLGHWPLDDGEGNISKDVSGIENNAAIKSPNWLKVDSKDTLFFNPEKKTKVSAAVIGHSDKELTIGAWFFCASPGTHSIVQRGNWRNRILIEKGKLHTTLHLDHDRVITIKAKEQNLLHQWVHAVTTYDGEKARFYVNGELNDERVAKGTLVPYGSLCVGAEGNYLHFSGFIQDVRLYNRALSEEKINSLFKEGKWRKDKEELYAKKTKECFPLNIQIAGYPVFFHEDSPKRIGRTFNLTSNLERKGKFFLETEISDYYGNTFKKKKIFILGPKGTKTFKVEIPYTGKLGIYSIKGEITEEESSYKFPIHGSFAVIKKPLNLEYNQQLKSPFGIITTLWTADDIQPSLSILKSCGINWVEIYRLFDWQLVEKEKGEYNFSEVDKLYNLFSKEGLMMTVMLSGKTNLYKNPLDPEAFGKYCYAIAEHFKGRISHWMIYGEPQHINFAPIYDGKPTAKGKWLDKFLYFSKIAAENIKKANPEAMTISAGMDGWSILKYFISHGIGDYCDIIGIEPYCYSPSCHGLPELCGKPAVTIYDDGKELRELLKKYNAPQRTWTTEVGWKTYETEVEKEVSSLSVSKRQQAALLVREYVISLASGIEKVFFWEWHSRATSSQGPGIIDYGTLNVRPSYAAYSTMSRLLETSTFERRLNLSPNLRGYTFKKGEEEVIVLWSIMNKDSTAIELLISPEKVTLIDIMGNEIERDENFFLVSFTPQPVYLIGKKKVIAKICSVLEEMKGN